MKRLAYIEVRMFEGQRAGFFGKPRYQVLVEGLWKMGAPGMTILRAEEGFDERGNLQTIHSEYLSDNLPLRLECVAEAQMVEAMLKEVQDPRYAVKEIWRTANVWDVKTEVEEGDPLSGVLKVYLRDEDTYKGVPLVEALLNELRGQSVEWVDVFQTLEGYGGDHVLRKNRPFRIQNQAPLLVEAVIPTDVDAKGLFRTLRPLLEHASGPAVLIGGEVWTVPS